MENRTDGWIMASNQSLSFLDETGEVSEVAQLEAHVDLSVRTNDGACDPWGRFWIGSMAFDSAEGHGSLYRCLLYTSTLMMVGIREVLIITTREHNGQFRALLGDGSQLGMRINYAVQPSPDGLAQAFIIGEQFIGNDRVALVLGDNIFHGVGLGSSLRQHVELEGGLIFAYRVADPRRYGVVDFDEEFQAMSIEEKPARPKSCLLYTSRCV